MTSKLRREQRLRSAREIQCVLRDATETKNYGILRVVRRNSQTDFPKLGISVAKRYVKSAVMRNLIKRVIREWFRLHQSEFPATALMVLSTHRFRQLTKRSQIKQNLNRVLDDVTDDLRRLKDSN